MFPYTKAFGVCLHNGRNGLYAVFHCHSLRTYVRGGEEHRRCVAKRGCVWQVVFLLLSVYRKLYFVLTQRGRSFLPASALSDKTGYLCRTECIFIHNKNGRLACRRTLLYIGLTRYGFLMCDIYYDFNHFII